MVQRNRTAYKNDPKALWDNYYRVRHNYFHSLDKEHIKLYGTRISGINELDARIEHEIIDTEMNIDRMFELWRKGVTISVVNYADTEEIYKHIRAHLISWADYISNGIHTSNAPVKDLIDLDRFAEVVYDKAVAVFTPEERQSGVASIFLKSQRINFFNVLRRNTVTDTSTLAIKDGEVDVIQPGNKKPADAPYRSFRELFADNLPIVNGWKEDE